MPPKIATTTERGTSANNTPTTLPTAFTDVVSIRAGNAEVQVHQDLICFHSDYFKTAFRGPFKEAAEQKITLEDVDENILHHFVHWLYHQTLRVTNDDGSAVDISSLGCIYIFAEAKKVPQLKNMVVTEYVRQIKSEAVPPYVDDITYVYSNTEASSVLRRLTVDNFIGSVADFKGYLDEEGLGDFPATFLADVAIAMQKHYDLPAKNAGIRRSRAWIKGCDYHDHADGKKCAMQG